MEIPVKVDRRIFPDRTASTKSMSQPFRALGRWGIGLFGLVLSVSVLHAQNAIQIENAKQGSGNWQATNLADNPDSYSHRGRERLWF